MMQRIGMAIGAGLAAALLFAVKGTLLAIALAYLAPLPIVIATLGWGLDMGGLAAAIASVGAAVVLDPQSGGLFAVSIGLPAWLLSFLGQLRRGRLYPFVSPRTQDKTWFPVGGIIAVAALISALLGAWELASLVLADGGYENGVKAGAAEIAPALTEILGDVVRLPSGVSVEEFAELIVRLSPAVSAGATCLMLCANLYAGARAVQLSQRLKRPWSNLPEALVLPPVLGISLIASVGLALTLPGPVGNAAWIGVSVLGCAYVMQGLAVVHSLSRGVPARIPMLVALYLVFWGALLLSLPVLALVGLIESLLSLRARRAAAANIKS